MLDFKRSNRQGDAKAVDRAVDRAVQRNAVSTPTFPATSPGGAAARPMPPSPGVAQEIAPAPAPPAAAPVAPVESASRAIGPDALGSKLIVGPNIKLKGVEISNCDVLVVEGQVEATVHSKAMQIATPGTLNGTAVIDVAEIDGTFTGELTAHTKLVVNGTGRVSGTIRYGCLIVAEGGEITGDVKRIDPTQTGNEIARMPMPGAHPPPSPEQTRLS